MKTKRAAVAAVLAGILVLAGCSTIKEGTVIDKKYEEGHYYSTTTCSLIGKTTVCTPHTQYDDPDWKVFLRNDKEEGWREITEESWNRVEVGQWLTIN